MPVLNVVYKCHFYGVGFPLTFYYRSLFKMFSSDWSSWKDLWSMDPLDLHSLLSLRAQPWQQAAILGHLLVVHLCFWTFSGRIPNLSNYGNCKFDNCWHLCRYYLLKNLAIFLFSLHSRSSWHSRCLLSGCILLPSVLSENLLLFCEWNWVLVFWMSHSIKSPVLVAGQHNRFCFFFRLFIGFHDCNQVSLFQVLITWFCTYDMQAIYNVKLCRLTVTDDTNCY